MIHPTKATAFAPASTSNLAVGFDILGHPLGFTGDRVTVTRRAAPGVVMGAVTGDVDSLPSDPALNTAGTAVMLLLQDHAPELGMEVEIEKGIPLGSGIGGSAASAVAAAVAANALLPRPLPTAELFPYALQGEVAASGAIHGDNVAPSLFGGLVLVRSALPPDVVSLPSPPTLRCVLVLPDLCVNTRDARAVLPRFVPLGDMIHQTANLAGVIAGCCTGDLELVARSLRDRVVEPHRASLIPGFHDVQAAAMEAGALGCSISGAGPSMFAWCRGDDDGERVRDAMMDAFHRRNIPARGWVSPVNGPGARVEAVE
ncbi:MAG TPA: homoserine kinase [Longimicrobium sp.]